MIAEKSDFETPLLNSAVRRCRAATRALVRHFAEVRP